MIKGKRIFISGGNGVIGNELVRLLHEEGAIVYVGDLKPRPSDWPKEIIYRQGDLNHITFGELENFGPQIFFHLAATFERSEETYEFWDENRRHNVQLSTHLMTLLKDMPGLEKVVFASSYLIYDPKLYKFDDPADKARRLSEGDPILPRNLTGAAKLNHEIELRFLNTYRAKQFRSVSARIYRSYGLNSRDIISRWIRSLLAGEALKVFKKEGMFDYIFAGDVAKGLMHLALDPTAEGIYNLGNDNARRVTEVLEILKKHFPSLTYTEHESPIEYEASQANMDLFQKTFGWKPERQLEDVIPVMIEYEKKQQQQKSDVEYVVGNILITSVSKKTALIRSVKTAAQKLGDERKVIGADANALCIGKYFTDGFWVMPKLSQLGPAEINQYCLSENIRVIIPTRDGELKFWSELKSGLAKQNIYVMVSDTDAVEACLDKLVFSQSLKQFPVIPSYLPGDTLPENESYVVKERYGAGSISIGMNVPKKEIQAWCEKLEHPIIQPFIKGEEFSVDVYATMKGKVRGAICRKRSLVVNGESQITTTVEYPELTKLCIEISEFVGLKGPAVFQALKDEKGILHIIECNCRFGGASSLSIEAGLDIFYWLLLEINGADMETYPFIPSKKELTQVRFSQDIVI